MPLLESTVSPTFAEQSTLMKFVPITVIVLRAYAAVGVMEAAVGLALTVRGVPETETDTPLANVTITDDATSNGVPAPITTVNVVAVAYVHKAATPLLGPTVAPTLADQRGALMKFVPVTVTVLPTYAAVGATEAAVGLALIVRGVPETETETPPFVNVTHTDDEAAGVPAPITTVKVVAVA